MRENKQLASRIAAVLAVITLAGTSTFAESRPSNGTRSRGAGGGIVRRGGASTGAVARRGNNSPNRSSERRVGVDRRPARGPVQDRGQARRRDRNPAGTRSFDRNRTQTRNFDRNRPGTGNYESYRGRSNWSRNGSNDSRRGGMRSGRGRGDGNRQPYFARGRVSRVLRHGGGYRVWIGGAPYPFFIPSSYYHRNRFRVGLLIGLGGFYNSLGYYDYYGGYNDSYRYRDSRGYSSGVLRGVVESVDYRRDTFVVRNEETGSFVTVFMRDRRGDDVRPGDYVEVSGDWTRSGLFQAYDVDLLDDDDRDR